MLISICIPTYNRPKELVRLLDSIDCAVDAVEIVICENDSPARAETGTAVSRFISRSPYKVVYRENEKNLGYDGNIRRLIEVASGDFVVFMGDDDWFIPGAFDRYIGFLSAHRQVAYVLRSYCAEHADGAIESFRYCAAVRYFKPSVETCAFMFKRSVSLAGLTFKRSSALAGATDRFDGTLLYQLHLVLETVFAEPSVFCDIPVAIAAQTFRTEKGHFGTSEKESRFQPGKVTPGNSIMFTRGFFEIAGAFDGKHGTKVSELIAVDLSKYSYPILSIQRKNGLWHFLKYSVALSRQTPINKTWHFVFYAFALALLGEGLCDKSIVWLKGRIGYTPSL